MENVKIDFSVLKKVLNTSSVPYMIFKSVIEDNVICKLEIITSNELYHSLINDIDKVRLIENIKTFITNNRIFYSADIDFDIGNHDNTFLFDTFNDGFIEINIIPVEENFYLATVKTIHLSVEDNNLKNTQSSEFIENLEFDKLFSVEYLQKIQDLFSNATGVASIITRIDGTPITKPSNFCVLCNDIIRKTEIGLKNCYKSDAFIGRYHPEGPVIQPCLSGGLWDAGVSITINGKHQANWLIGQVRNEEQNIDEMKNYAKVIGADENQFMEAFYKVPEMSKEKFDEISKVLYEFVNQLTQLAYNNLEQKKLIDDLNSAKDKIKSSEERLKIMFEYAPDAYYMIDTKGCFVDGNKAAEKLIGYKKEDLIGKSFLKVGILPLNQFPKAMSILGQNLMGKPTGPDELVLRNSNYDLFPVEIRTFPIKIDGKYYILGIARDITERKKYEQQILDKSEELDRFFTSALDLLCIADTDGYFRKLNSEWEKVLGYRTSELIGTRFNDFVHENDIESSAESLNSLEKGSKVFNFVNRYRSKDGTYRWIEWRSVPHGNLIYSCARDISERISYEEELRNIYRTFADVIESIPSGLIIYKYEEPDFLYLETFNPQSVKLTGINLHEFIGKEFNTIWTNAKVSGLTDSYLEVMKTGKTFEVQDWNYSDEKISGFYRIKAFRLPQQKLCVTFENITYIKEAEITIKHSEEKFKTLVENAFDAIYIMEGINYTYVNNQFAQLTGYTREEIIGKDFSYENFLTETSRQIIKKRYQDRLDGLEVQPRYETQLKHKDGHSVDVEISTVSINEKENLKVIGIIRDITERKKKDEKINEALRRAELSEAELKKNKAVLLSVINNLPFDLWVRDINQVCFLQNAKSIEYWGNLIGNTPESQGIDDETYKVWISNNSKVLKGQTINEEIEVLDIYGNKREFQNVIAPIFENDEIHGIIGINIDISERKNFERELIAAKLKAEESDVLKTAFLRNISHEVRTPLNGIIGFATMVTNDDVDLNTKKDYISIIKQSSHRLISTINNIIYISQLQTKQIEVKNEMLSVLELCNDLHDEYYLIAKEKELNFQFDNYSENDVYIYSDREKLNNMLSYLLDNAIKFTSSGEVNFGFELKSAEIMFYVKDTGIGIENDKIEKIFNLFEQMDLSISRSYEGSGIGLSIVKGLAKLLKGRIEVESEVNKGSKFMIYIPLI